MPAAGLYLIWVLLTWPLESRVQTLLRPETELDRPMDVAVAGREGR